MISSRSASSLDRPLGSWSSFSDILSDDHSSDRSSASSRESFGDRLQSDLHELDTCEPKQIAALADRARRRPGIGYGKEAEVYALPTFGSLVLRCDHESHGRPIPAAGLRYVPVALEPQVGLAAAREDIGLPRAVLVETNHPVHGSIAVSEIARAYPKILFQILNRCSGASISQHVSRNLTKFLNEYRAQQASIEAEPKPMAAYRKRDYQKNMMEYLNFIDRVGFLPQPAFDEAVESLRAIGRAPGTMHMSLSHGGNTLIDFAQERIRFVDLNMNGTGSRPSLEALAMVLCGAQYTTAPWKHIRDASYREVLAESIGRILHKIRIAAKKCDVPWETVDTHPHPQTRRNFEELLAELHLD